MLTERYTEKARTIQAIVQKFQTKLLQLKKEQNLVIDELLRALERRKMEKIRKQLGIEKE